MWGGGAQIIRGKNGCKSGDELIDKLDRRIANDARLREKVSFFVLKDPFPDPEEQMLDPLNWPEVLFVAGPKVTRDPEVVLRTAISAFGIATAWYGSIYPFLANPRLLDRATEVMELADAGMPTDLAWLSDMSIPLFSSFMALQLVHEIAHQAVARSRNFEASVPTLVPSVLSGITGSITSLKSSPRNKQDLVEFAVAGPLAGMIGSVFVLCYGLALTAAADASTVQAFPGIPLATLRQSSLGGGLIDLILGGGVLNVPASAEGAQALASTLIALHPYAVSGFVSLVVNALALVPAGSEFCHMWNLIYTPDCLSMLIFVADNNLSAKGPTEAEYRWHYSGDQAVRPLHSRRWRPCSYWGYPRAICSCSTLRS